MTSFQIKSPYLYKLFFKFFRPRILPVLHTALAIPQALYYDDMTNPELYYLSHTLTIFRDISPVKDDDSLIFIYFDSNIKTMYFADL